MIFQPYVLTVITVSAAYGLFVGSIPGLTATMAAALMVPLTFFMEPIPALAAIVTMEAMAIFAGDIPGALVHIPGTPTSAAYCDESYAFTKRGQAGFVLGVDLSVAVIGGLIGAVILICLAPALAEIAMMFTSFEYFWLACIGLSCTVLVSRGAVVKGMVSLLIGLLLTTVGVDITIGFARFTFGITEFLNGFNYVPALIGMFGVAEVFRNAISGNVAKRTTVSKTGALFKGVPRVIKRYKVNIARSGLLGTAIGVLPGAGSDLAAWVAYALSKRFSKTPEKFGSGHIEGIVDAGTANNASLGGGWVPALVFGIPGDSVTAIVIGVLYMKGLRPGPMIFQQTPEILYAVYIAFIFANLLMIPMGYLAIKTSGQMLRVPHRILMPVILMFCTVGAFAINNTVFDVGIMLFTAGLAYIMINHGFPIAPTILGMVLGRLLEESFMTSMMKSDMQIAAFFERPVSAILGVTALLLWVSPVIMAVFKRITSSDQGVGPSQKERLSS